MTATNTQRASTAPSRRGAEVLDVTVLAGGPGAEREVSLDSGRAVHAALKRIGHRAELLDIGPDNLAALDRPADFVFIALHGEFGEDGALQTILDQRGLLYSGSGAAASRLAMNKVESKKRFEQAGIPTPPYAVLERPLGDDSLPPVELPAVVKPISSGSSVDTSIVRTPEELRRAASSVVERHGAALVERFVAGRELTVGILGDQALPVCEIRTTREFYDYHAKYVDDTTRYLFDIDLPPTTLERVQALSLRAHQALGCSVFSRVDCILDGKTNEPFFLEVNTIPGFTSHSLVPKGAARRGMSFDQLCARIIELSRRGS